MGRGLLLLIGLALISGVAYLSFIVSQHSNILIPESNIVIPDWTGIVADPTPVAGEVTDRSFIQIQVVEREKDFWDWAQLLLIPAVLTFGVYWLNIAEKERDQISQARREKENRALEEQRLQSARIIEERREKEATLQIFFDQMTHLLLEKNLRNSQPEDEVRSVARARTLTAIRRLDAERQQQLIRFLGDAGLLVKGMNILELSKFNLSEVNLSKMNLRDIDLSETALKSSVFNDAMMSGAVLTSADLREASLINADLSNATLQHANLAYANLEKANLQAADLRRAKLY